MRNETIKIPKTGIFFLHVLLACWLIRWCFRVCVPPMIAKRTTVQPRSLWTLERNVWGGTRGVSTVSQCKAKNHQLLFRLLLLWLVVSVELHIMCLYIPQSEFMSHTYRHGITFINIEPMRWFRHPWKRRNKQITHIKIRKTKYLYFEQLTEWKCLHAIHAWRIGTHSHISTPTIV